MDLREYLEIIARRKWVIILTTLFALVVTILGALNMPTQYTAHTKIRVPTTKIGGADYFDYDVEYAERLKDTYATIATSAPVLGELSQYVERLPQISVKSISNTELLEIDVTDTDPALAQFSANKLAEILVAQSKELYSGDVNPVNIYVVETADLPTKPSSINPIWVVVMGFLAGLIGGLSLAFLFENLDTRLYTAKQAEAVTKLAVVGDIPEDRQRQSEGDILLDSRLHAEAFRRLRTNIFAPLKNKDLKTLLIASAVTNDGRSTITANLGVSMAQSGYRVIIVDGNLRWPAIDKIFELNNERGLCNVLKGYINVSDVIQRTGYPSLDVVTSGPVPSNPVELLASERMAVTLGQLKQRYDVILVDSPALLSVTDAAVLAPQVDGVLLVIRHGWVRKEALLSSLKQLQTVNANLVGVVLNRTGLGTTTRFLDLSIRPTIGRTTKQVRLASQHAGNGKHGAVEPMPASVESAIGEQEGEKEQLSERDKGDLVAEMAPHSQEVLDERTELQALVTSLRDEVKHKD